MQRPERVRGHPAEQRASLLGDEQPGERRAGQQGRQPEPGQRQRMAGRAQQRPHDVVGQLVVLGRRPAEHKPPAGSVPVKTGGGVLDGAVQQPGVAAVERVRAVDLRPPPGQPVPVQAEAVQERRAGRHRMECRAVVVQQAGHQRLAGARAAADLVGRLQHGDPHAVGGEGHRGGEPVRPAAHHRRGAHAGTSRS